MSMYDRRFAPVLRQLRQVAMVFYVSKPKLARLAARLKYIAEQEALKVDSRALLMLGEITEGDLRSCLNTIQVR
jgi:chromosome transmission fidelity protein 18